MDVKITDVNGQRTSTQEQILSIRRALLDQKRLPPEETNRLSGQLLQLGKTLTSLGQQLKLLHQQREELKVVSPIDGEVVTWQIRDTLIHRPVQKGQVLMSVVDPDGTWELELHMSEDRMGFIAAAEKKQQEPLETTYILATEPGKKHIGHVKEVKNTPAEVRGEEGNTVLMLVSVNKEDFTDRRPGASVTAKVYCGWAPIGYVWFHDLIGFVQTKILFRL